MVTSQPRIFSDRSSTDSISSTQSATISTISASSVSIEIDGTWTGSIDFEATVDGVNWVPVKVYPLPEGPAVYSTTENGRWTTPVGGFNSFRVIGNTITSGTASSYISATAAAPVIQPIVGAPVATSVSLIHDEAALVGANIETAILTVNASTEQVRVMKIDCSGENIAHFKVKVDSVVKCNKRSWFGNFNQTFDFDSGLVLEVGQSLVVSVIHTRSSACNFEATAMVS